MLSSMGKDRAPARPNILVVMFDQLTPSALGCYGNPVAHAPTLDRLAREGVVFDAAYSNSPLCTPARYCMMTGQLPRLPLRMLSITRAANPPGSSSAFAVVTFVLMRVPL